MLYFILSNFISKYDSVTKAQNFIPPEV